VTASTFSVVHRDLIVAVAAGHKLPSVYYSRLEVLDRFERANIKLRFQNISGLPQGPAGRFRDMLRLR
jgi:hypothetical protein